MPSANPFAQLQAHYQGPTEFTATDRRPKKLRYTLRCPAGLPAGTDVRVSIARVRSFSGLPWTLEGVDVLNAAGRRSKDGGSVVLGHVIPQGWDALMRGGDTPAGGGMMGRQRGPVHLCSAVVTTALAPGAQLRFSLTGVLAPSAVDGQLELRIRRQRADTFQLVDKPVVLRNRPGKATRLELRPTQPDANGTVRLSAFATDDCGNPVTTYKAHLQLEAEGAADVPATINITNAGTALLEINTSADELPARIHARDNQRNLEATSPPIVGRKAQHGVYFGGIHFHTNFSIDGDRKLEDAYAYARDYLNLDVIAVTDHAPLGLDWEETLRINETFYDPGRFVTIPAWESSNAYGHANVFLRTPASRGHTGMWRPDTSPSDNPWPDDVVVIPHHTTSGQYVFPQDAYWEYQSTERYWGAYDWSVANNRVRLVEIVQARGSAETNERDTYWGVRNEGTGASVRDALGRGQRIGFVAGTDNHLGFPIQIAGVYTGLTAFLAPELSRDAIWCAMDQRHTYATSGMPIVCHFEVNGQLMGSKCSIERGSAVHFNASLHGTAPIERVEIISNGITVWQSCPNDWDLELRDIELTAALSQSAYYYLRLRQADGHRAWLSPVWLDVR